MFIRKTNSCNFADDNTLYKSSLNVSVVLSNLEHENLIVLDPFKVNLLKVNPDKNSVYGSRRKGKFPIQNQI